MLLKQFELVAMFKKNIYITIIIVTYIIVI